MAGCPLNKSAAALCSRFFLDSHDIMIWVIEMKIKHFFLLLVATAMLLFGCSAPTGCDIATTTYPVYAFTQFLCQNTPLQVERVITENVSCLHDYTLQVHQMQLLQGADTVVISGAGLEDFMADALASGKQIVDASENIPLLHAKEAHDDHDHHEHHHEEDPHMWLSPDCGLRMAENICTALCATYPAHTDIFRENLKVFREKMADLRAYGEEKLGSLSCRELITFHDGFAYLAEAFDLTVIKAIEEESGSEASAHELIEIAELIREHKIPAVFIEVNGAVSAAQVISAETGIPVFTLDMAMSGDYFEAMYKNIDTLWEALQ